MHNVIAPNHLLLAHAHKLLNRFKFGAESLALLVLIGHARLAQTDLLPTLTVDVMVILVAARAALRQAITVAVLRAILTTAVDYVAGKPSAL